MENQREEPQVDDRSVGNTSAPSKRGARQNVPLDYVTQVQNDLLALGYLRQSAPKELQFTKGHYDKVTRHAVWHFQRSAMSAYRMTTGREWLDVPVAERFTRPERGWEGICDHATAQEIQKWLKNRWVLPFGKYRFSKVVVDGRELQLLLNKKPLRITPMELREDVAADWVEIVKAARDEGATLEAPYGDARRTLGAQSAGSSKRSFHFAGRAVDISQQLADIKPGIPGYDKKRYYIVRDGIRKATGQPYWRIYCTTEKREGPHIQRFNKGDIKWMEFFNNTEYPIPAGHYVDLTGVITSTGKFEQIAARKGWERNGAMREWWHFQHTVEQQQGFLEEMELVGTGEDELLRVKVNDRASNTSVNFWTLDTMSLSPG